MMYTSLELSKALQEAGCELESNFGFLRKHYYEKSKLKFLDKYEKDLQNIKNFRKEACLFSYDILLDICVKYRDKFFKDKTSSNGHIYFRHTSYCLEIFGMILQDKDQKEIEKYIINNSVFFNKKNKEKKK